MRKANAAFVRAELMDLVDLEVVRILALNPTEGEVLEAGAWLDGDEELIRAYGAPTSTTVARIVAMVQAALYDAEHAEHAR